MTRNVVELILLAQMISIGVSSDVQAARITNLDPDPHTIEVTSEDQDQKRTSTFTIAPSASIELGDACPRDCIVVLVNGAEYVVLKGEGLLIEENAIFAENPFAEPPHRRD